MSNELSVMISPQQISENKDLSQRCDAIANAIDMGDLLSLNGFGSAPAEKAAHFASQALQHTVTGDFKPLNEGIARMKLAVKGLHPERLDKNNSGFFSRLIFNFKTEVTKLETRFQSVDTNLQDIEMEFRRHIQETKESIIVLRGLHDAVYDDLQELVLHVAAGEKRLKQEKETLQSLQLDVQTIAASGDQVTITEKQRDLDKLRAAVDLLDRRVTNLEKSRVIFIGLLPVLGRGIESGFITLQEFEMLITQAIPAWKVNATTIIEQLKTAERLEALAEGRSFTESQLEQIAQNLEQNETKIMEQTREGIASTDKVIAMLNSLDHTLTQLDTKAAQVMAEREDARKRLGEAVTVFAENRASH